MYNGASQARLKRRTSHAPNLMLLMSKIYCSCSLLVPVRQRVKLCRLFFFFSVFSVFSYLLLCIALDLGTRIRTHALRENFGRVHDIWDSVSSATFCKQKQNKFEFYCLLLFYGSVCPRVTYITHTNCCCQGNFIDKQGPH